MSTPTTSDIIRIPVATFGSGAARIVVCGGAGRVAAVFERSIHIEFADGILCIGGPSIGNGPLNVVIAERQSPMWPARIERGEPVEVSGHDIRLRNRLLDCRDAAVWRPEPWPQPAGKPAIRDVLERVRSIAWDRAPREGLSRLVVFGGDDGGGAQQVALARIAVPVMTVLGDWLENISIAPAQRFSSPLAGEVARSAGGGRGAGAAGAPPPPPLRGTSPARGEERPNFPVEAVGLLGLGPGLTPSGDDLLCGVLIGLHAIGAARLAGEMARSVLRAAPLATTPLSCAFLSAAAEGEGSEALHAFVAVVIAARTDQLDVAVDCLARIGHTSGWDALAGAFLALTAWVSAPPPTRSP